MDCWKNSWEPFVQCYTLKKKLQGFVMVKRLCVSRCLLSLSRLWVVGKVAGWSDVLSHPSEMILPALVLLANRNKEYLVFLGGPEIISRSYTQGGYKVINLTSDSLAWLSTVLVKRSVDSISYHLSKSPGGIWWHLSIFLDVREVVGDLYYLLAVGRRWEAVYIPNC